MTVLHICSVENKKFFGSTIAVLNHVNEQAKLGSDRILVCHVKGTEMEWDDAVEVVSLESLRNDNLQVDLVVFHEIYYMPYFSLAKYFRKRGIPYVVVPHGGLTHGAQGQRRIPKQIVNILWAKEFIRNAKAIQFLSEMERDSAVKWNSETIISSNGVHIPTKSKVYCDEDNKALRLIYIGRINLFYKGLDLLCQACAKIKNELRQKQVMIDLHGPQEGEDFEELVRLITDNQIEDIVRVKSPVFHEEKEATMLAADAFIQPSRSEGQPMGILDAMASGLPVIVTPGTTFAEEVSTHDCGWTTKSEVDAIAETLLQVYAEKDKLGLKSKNARAYMERQYAWGIVAERTLELYRNLIS